MINAPLKAMDRDLVLREQAARVSLALDPLVRSDPDAALARIYAAMNMARPTPLLNLDAALLRVCTDVDAYLAAQEGGGAPEWVPEGALAAGNFATGEYFLAGEACELSDLLTGDNFDPTRIEAEVGMTVTLDSGEGAFANPNIPLMTPALLALFAGKDVGYVAKIKGLGNSLNPVLVSLMDNVDYNSASNQVVWDRQNTRVRVADWVDLAGVTEIGAWPDDTDSLVGFKMSEPSPGVYDYEIAANGSVNDAVVTTPLGTFVIGAIGISENVNDPSSAAGDDHIIEWFAVVPSSSDLAALTAS